MRQKVWKGKKGGARKREMGENEGMKQKGSGGAERKEDKMNAKWRYE